MGKKETWFSSVKKALSPDSKEKKVQNSKKSKKKWFGKQKLPNSDSTSLGPATAPSPPQPEEVKITHLDSEEVDEPRTVGTEVTSVTNQSSGFTYDENISQPEQSGSAVIPFAAAEIVQLPQSRFSGLSKDEAAALRIQTVFRGYLARRALRALRGLVRLKSLMESSTVKRQASNTLRCMQTLARVQSQIHFRRVRMLEENQALQKQLLQKHAKELESFRIGEEWDDSIQSKEQIEASLLSKYEATMRRERALAYAFTHQKNWKNSTRSLNPSFMDPSNPTWGWSWLERWSGARTHDGHDSTGKEANNSKKNTTRSINITGGEISKSYARYQLNLEVDSPTSSQKTSQSAFQPTSVPPKPTSSSPATRKLKPPSPRNGILTHDDDDDSKSVVTAQSERVQRRHSTGGSSVRDDESVTTAVRSYMTPTESARAKSRLQSPFVAENNGTPEKVASSSLSLSSSSALAKKRLSYPPSPARPRRLSGPPKIESVSNGVGG